MKFPDKLDVLTAHARLIEETGGSAGIRDEALLESALAAAPNRHNYEGGDLATCSATYAYHPTPAHASLMVISELLPQSRKHFWKAMEVIWL